MNKIKIFEISIWNKILNDITDNTINAALSFCMEQTLKSKGVVFSNIGGWQSNHLTFDDIEETPLEPIFNVIAEETDLQIQKYSNLITEYGFSTLWINVNKKDNYNDVHSHPKSIISGVYYLTDNNSSLEFFFPFNHKSWSDVSVKNYIHTPKKNELLLFPSYLLHMVHPNQTDNPRVSLAFNLTSTEKKFNFINEQKLVTYD